MITPNILVYSTVAGELVSLVRDEIPKCFVEYKDYLELWKELQELKAEYKSEE